MNRRGFLKSILAIGVAPAVVRAESLMPLWTPERVAREISGREIMAMQDEFYYAHVSPLAMEDLSNAARVWSARLFAETLKSPEMTRFMVGRQWGKSELSGLHSPPIILNTIPPFEQKPTPRRDVATLLGLRSKGPFI